MVKVNMGASVRQPQHTTFDEAMRAVWRRVKRCPSKDASGFRCDWVWNHTSRWAMFRDDYHTAYAGGAMRRWRA